MGVRFYDKKNMSTVDNYTPTTHNCNTCNQQTQTFSSTTASTSATATQTTNGLNMGNNLCSQNSSTLRDIVGNSKEVRIEENFHNLRIVGNNNRIRITVNVGNITIIGNNTRLKIKTNHGHIKYTGNDGCISLGKNSTEQLVDYSGCNGVLKVQSSKKSNKVNDENDDEIKHNIVMGSTGFNGKLNISEKQKHSSYNGSQLDSEMFNFNADYNNIFNRKLSLPDVTTKSFHSKNVSSVCSHQLEKNLRHNFSNIVIANSSNIYISPPSYIL